MKKYLLLYTLLAAVVFTSCEKNDGPISKEIKVERVPAPLIVKDPTGSPSIDMVNLAGFQGKVNISLYFPNDIPPTKLDIVVRKNGNNANVKLLLADVKTYPTSITITAAQLQTLFGAPIVLGDTYDIGANVYAQSGRMYEAFPIVGNGYAAAFQPDHPGFSAQVRFAALCAYNSDVFNGNFVVETDDWDDTQPGDVIVFTKIDATHFSFIYPTVLNPVPIIVTVNPIDNSATIARQQIGSHWVYGAIYTQPRADAVGFVSPCEQRITLNMVWGYSAGTFTGGPFPFILKKQ